MKIDGQKKRENAVEQRGKRIFRKAEVEVESISYSDVFLGCRSVSPAVHSRTGYTAVPHRFTNASSYFS
jgi:hypothetical protein